jgi:hypothetical protein
MLARIRAAIAPAGMIVRGGFHPRAGDAVPPLPDGTSTRTVVLIGNAGGDMWRAFAAAPRDPGEKNPLDAWLRPRILGAARAAGAHAIFPNDGPPFVPIQDWAARAEPVHRSPLGIMIHPEFGLWHVYRAALCFAETLELPPREDRPSPCDSCEERPCLKVCPADAFGPTRFKFEACVSHVASEQGTPCRERGCLARRACPVGRAYVYPRPAQAFHTAAFVRAARRAMGGNA